MTLKHASPVMAWAEVKAQAKSIMDGLQEEFVAARLRIRNRCGQDPAPCGKLELKYGDVTITVRQAREESTVHVGGHEPVYIQIPSCHWDISMSQLQEVITYLESIQGSISNRLMESLNL